MTDAWQALLVTLFPARCAGCNVSLPLYPSSGFCVPCFEGLEQNDAARCKRCDQPIDQCTACRDAFYTVLRAPFIYGGPITQAVVRFKFQGREDLSRPLEWLMAQDPKVQQLVSASDALVPVPLGAKRKRQRGYNQSALLARRLGKRFDTPVRYALRRKTETLPQSDLSLSKRIHNVHGAFESSNALMGLRVVLVDDVVTSTQTIAEASRCLMERGCASVSIVALARAFVGHAS